MQGYSTNFDIIRNTSSGQAQGVKSAGSPAPAKKKEKGAAGKKEEKKPEFSNPVWLDAEDKQITEAYVNDEVTLSIDIKNAENGDIYTIKIFEKDKVGEDDFVKQIDASVKDGKLTCSWTFEYMEDTDDTNSEQEQEEKGYTKPEFFFYVEVDENTRSVESGVLEMKDWVSFNVIDEMGNINQDTLKIILQDGSEIKKTPDSNGFVKIEDLLPGKSHF
jgi:hypothetical protein